MELSLISVLTFLTVTFVGVHAQNISQCVLNCISQAASANGCDLTNTECLCTNTKLQQAAMSCLQQSCTAQDLQNAESLLDSECATESIPLSLTTSTLSPSSLAVGRFTTTIIAAVPLPDPTFSALPTPTPTPSARKSSLTTGGVVGIAVATSATTICLAIVASFWYMRRRKQRKSVHRDDSAAANLESASVRTSWKPESRRHSDTGHAHGGVLTVTTRTDSEEIHLYDNNNDSLAARVASMDFNLNSTVPDPLLITPYPQLESGHPLIAPEKSFGRPGNRRIVPTSPVRRLEDNPVVESPVPSGHEFEQRRAPRYETDGGVRVAGGRVGEAAAPVDSDQHTLISEGSTLPPPYSSHFGET